MSLPYDYRFPLSKRDLAKLLNDPGLPDANVYVFISGKSRAIVGIDVESDPDAIYLELQDEK